MKTKQILLSVACVLIYVANALAQKNIVNVDPLTGAGRTAIPVYSFTRGQVTFPVSLVYAGNGVKIKDVEGTAGMGWNLQAGGQVSRVVRGLPDDCSLDNSFNAMYGWMNASDTVPPYISAITDNLSNCTNETTDLSYITAHFPANMDTEPDIFYVSAPGLSCQLIYDRNLPGFRPLNYQDLKISYTTSSGQITGFTIINDNGIKYVFNVAEQASMRTATSGPAPVYFTTKYNQYINGINYYDAWYLSSITDATGVGISLAYTTGTYRLSTDPITLFIGGSNTASPQYTIRSSVTPKTLSTVSTIDDDGALTELTFNWTSNPKSGGGTDQMYIDSITGLNKHLLFGYSAVKYVTAGGASYYRQFLRSFKDGTNPNSPVSYTFTYYGETLSSGNYTTTLPDSSSFKTDYWGYFANNGNPALQPAVYINPSNASYPRYIPYRATSGGTDYPYNTSGYNLSPDTANTKTGCLQTITNANGSPTIIAWESNNYVDPETGSVLPAAGVRVQAVKYAPGLGSPPTTINYSYVSPSTGLSSGRPVSLPLYAFSIPYGGTATGSSLYTSSTSTSLTDLSAEDHTIMYGYSKVSQTNGGSTLYQFYQPATYWDLSATPGCSGCTTPDWAPTVDMIARHNCASSYGPIKNDRYSYPFIPNPNYNFERGLLQKATTYLDNGTEVSEANYTYQRSFTPSAIYGFRYETNPNGSLVVTNYNKYAVNYNTSELTTTVSTNVYNTNGYTVPKNSTVSYTYGSANHKRLTQQDVANSDGSTITTKISYVKDYPSAGSGTNHNVNAIYNLNLLNVNIPIETYQLENRAGTTNITDGSLTLFSDFTGGAATFYLPSQQLQFVQPNGLAPASFTPFNATGSGSSQTLTYDSHYFTTANYTNYDYTGFPRTADDNNHHVVTSCTDHFSYKPYLVVKNAGVNEIGFQDFDSWGYLYYSSTGTAGTSFTTGGHGNSNYYLMPATQTYSRSITKSGLASNYVFSIWANATNLSANTINVSLNGGAPIACTFTGAGAWKYYEWKIPVGAMPTTFTFAYTPAQTTSIDDVLIYPDNAEVTTMTYDRTTHFKIMQTDTNGVSVYFNSDQWGRILYIYDQDHNIIQRNKYTIQLFN